MFSCFLTFLLNGCCLAECRSAIQCKLSAIQCKLSITYQEKIYFAFKKKVEHKSSTAFKNQFENFMAGTYNGPESEKCERFKDLKGLLQVKVIYMSTCIYI